MTYIIGFSIGNYNSIISDCRVTYGSSFGANTVLKTGLLLPGCIFGRVGDEEESRKFILTAKYAIAEEKSVDTIQGIWNRLLAFIENYQFPEDDNRRFKLLLSSRASGKPKFYILDSKSGIETVEGPLDRPITLGSGKAILDDPVHQEYSERIQEIDNQLGEVISSQFGIETSRSTSIYPYCLCLWLTEMSKSFEQSLLENHGVGGVFHFLLQGSNTDYCQEPSLYLLVDAKRKQNQMVVWIYRVSYVDNWLVVTTGIPPGQISHVPEGKRIHEAILDEASLPPSPSGFADTNLLLEQLKETIYEKLEEQPLYFFCGVGYMDPKHRKAGFGPMEMTTEKNYQFDRENISPQWKAEIQDTVVRSEIMDILDAGHYLYKQGQMEEAADLAIRATQMSHQEKKLQLEIDALSNLGLIHKKSGDLDKAIRMWVTAILVQLFRSSTEDEAGISESIIQEMVEVKDSYVEFLNVIEQTLRSEAIEIADIDYEFPELNEELIVNMLDFFENIEDKML